MLPLPGLLTQPHDKVVALRTEEHRAPGTEYQGTTMDWPPRAAGHNQGLSVLSSHFLSLRALVVLLLHSNPLVCFSDQLFRYSFKGAVWL